MFQSSQQRPSNQAEKGTRLRVDLCPDTRGILAEDRNLMTSTLVTLVPGRLRKWPSWCAMIILSLPLVQTSCLEFRTVDVQVLRLCCVPLG